MARHALVVRLDNDGDVLLAGPAVRAVAAGSERVTVLCGPRGAQAAALLPGVDGVLVRRAEWIDPEAPPVARDAIEAYVDAIAQLGADVAIVLTSFHQGALPAALLLRMAGVGCIAAISEDFPGSLLDVRIRDPGDVHETERALLVASALGFALPAGDDGRLRANAAPPPRGLPERYVVVHPGTSVPARAWPPDRHAALVTALLAQDRAVVVTGAPGERDLTAAVAGAPRHDGVAVDLGGATTLAELAGVLAGADAVVVGNTGPAHLAAAVGTPVVSLFAPTVPTVRWRPWGVPHVLLHRDVPCAGCRARDCPVVGHPCLTGVDVAEVLAAVERLTMPRVPEAAAA
ncbi:MAG: glycosyl transferase, family 9 [Conexibacter sp.]|nr:glycosyl transferase, family 9 [Conexibacter sp.]